MKTFKELNLTNNLKRAIEELGFTEPTPIQEQAIPIIQEGNDLIALSHTGSGKTLAFGLGAIEKADRKNSRIQVLILCPTRELVMQTTNVIKDLAKYSEGVRILSVFGGQEIRRQITLLKKRPQILIGTPGRIIDHIRRKTIRLDSLNMLVLDEADEMLDMGFRQDLDQILSIAPVERQTLLFSATMSDDIKTITKEYQQNAITLKMEEEDQIPHINQSYIMTKDSKNKDQILIKMLEQSNELSIIFCNTKSKVDSLAKLLSDKDLKIESLHGDMRQGQRHKIMKLFKENKVDALITTDVAARGIDVNDIKRVINYDFPNEQKYYVHRIGRTARAGKDGESITFIRQAEVSKLKNLEKEINATIKEITPDYLKDLIKTVDVNTNRMFISMGKLDNITGTQLKDFIIKKTDIKESDITNIEVFEKFSFFNITKDKTDKVVNILKELKYNNRKIGIEISTKPSGGGRGNQSRNNRRSDFDKKSRNRSKDNSKRNYQNNRRGNSKNRSRRNKEKN